LADAISLCQPLLHQLYSICMRSLYAGIGVREGILLGGWNKFALKITICPETHFLV